MSDYIKVELTEEQYDKISKIGFTKLEVASIGCKMTIGGGSSDFEMTLMDKDRFNQPSSDSEALGMIDTTLKQVESLAKGDVVEWKNGDSLLWKNGNGEFLECNTGRYIGYDSVENKHIFVRTDVDTYYIMHAKHSAISKPESQEQKAERERLDEINEIASFITSLPTSVKILPKSLAERIHDAGYRKGKK